MRRSRFALAVMLGVGCQRSTPDSAETPPTPNTKPVEDATEPAARSYLGRVLAPTMTYHGAGWLTRPERDAEENTKLMHEQLALAPGDVACDIGAGNGYHTLRMAKAVAPEGRAVAVDIQPEMLELMRARATREGVTNIESVQGELADPRLRAGTCDLVLLVDVYHEFSDPAGMLGHLRRSLSPKGRIALLEFRAEDPAVPIKELHKMSKAQILKEFSANKLELADAFDDLPWQHMMFFRAAES